MIKIQPIVKEIVMSEFEAYIALTNGYMNMSSYAQRIQPQVEERTKKEVTINGLVVALSRLRDELETAQPLIQKVPITNITTKLPLSEIIYENTDTTIDRLESFHAQIAVTREDFFTTTISTSELSIVCSSNLVSKILGHFDATPKFTAHNLAAIGISFDQKQFDVPNTLFSLIAVIARARINIAEIVSTYTELIFVVSEKDFAETVRLFSELHKETHENI